MFVPFRQVLRDEQDVALVAVVVSRLAELGHIDEASASTDATSIARSVVRVTDLGGERTAAAVSAFGSAVAIETAHAVVGAMRIVRWHVLPAFGRAARSIVRSASELLAEEAVEPAATEAVA